MFVLPDKTVLFVYWPTAAIVPLCHPPSWDSILWHLMLNHINISALVFTYLLTYLLTSSTSKLLIANVMKTIADQAFRVTVAWAQNLLPVTLKTCQTQLVFQCVLKMLLRYPSWLSTKQCWLVGWELMALLTQIRSYCAFRLINYFEKIYLNEGKF